MEKTLKNYIDKIVYKTLLITDILIIITVTIGVLTKNKWFIFLVAVENGYYAFIVAILFLIRKKVGYVFWEDDIKQYLNIESNKIQNLLRGRRDNK